MLLEETPSGNLRLFSPARPDTGVRFTRADVRILADVFELLDQWAREESAGGGVERDH